jgi:hypothetical protein
VAGTPRLSRGAEVARFREMHSPLKSGRIQALALSAWVCGSACAPKAPPGPAQPVDGGVVAADGYWAGKLYRSASYAAVLFFDLHGRELQHAYIGSTGGPHCGNNAGIADSVFRQRAVDFLRGVNWSFLHTDQVTVARSDDLVTVSASAGDFSADAVFHTDGALLLSYSRVWRGGGVIFYPADPIGLSGMKTIDSMAPSPWRVTRKGIPPSALLPSVRKLELTRALARQAPYAATLIYYSRDLQPVGRPGYWVVILTTRGICQRG